MKLMIASDIHGSAYYLDLLLKCFEEENPDRLLLLGDILYHGPRNDLPEGYNPKEVAKIGEYGKGRGKRDTWVYIDEDGKHFTHGNPAAMPMWFATKEMEMSVERIVREVFR